jgi:hypothetical protein
MSNAHPFIFYIKKEKKNKRGERPSACENKLNGVFYEEKKVN